MVGSVSPSIVLLSPNASPSLSVVGNGSLTVNVSGGTSGGAVVVDSTASNAISATGNANLTAPQFVLAGNDHLEGNAKITTTPTANNIRTGANPVPNPLASLPTPTTTGLTTQSAHRRISISGNTTETLSPGVYVGGISISANADVTLQSGIYYMEGGGFSISGNANVDGSSGVMIYNDGGNNGAISIAGNGVVNLSPMTTGNYAGITLFQNPTSTTQVSIVGNAALTISLSGAFYAADANLSITGNGGNLGDQYIVSTLTLGGNGTLNVGYGSTTLAPEREFGLVQ